MSLGSMLKLAQTLSLNVCNTKLHSSDQSITVEPQTNAFRRVVGESPKLLTVRF